MKDSQNEKVVIISYKMYDNLQSEFEKLCIEYEILRKDYFELLDTHTNECLLHFDNYENTEDR